ncbi:hypothetical protein [Maricaulis sp.]|uniref:hypothetical protein n=1 Tax=Maricaulis sp. TaxID=1486257 RepID=UPI002639CF23|nr:hypothetical protein [Maricaulis sp.]
MLLRRLSEHVRTQNWIAVAIDFVIVLVGVLLAFQINAWNESRLERAEQAAALDRLLSESEEAVVYLRRSIARFEEGNTRRVELLTRLNDDNWDGFDNDAMAQAIVTIGRAPPAAPPRSAYDEVIASGLFSGIGDAEVRDAITEYYASVDYLNGMSVYIQRLASWDPYWRYDSTTDVFAPDFFYQTRTLVDVEAIRANAEFAEMLVRGHRVQIALTEWWQGALEDAQAMCEALAGFSQSECEAAATD